MLPVELENIVNKFNEIEMYLKSFKIEDFEKYSRNELKLLEENLKDYSFGYDLKYQIISKLIGKKKIEEYPELVGVHHYPEIKKIEFLDEEEKIKLDTYLYELGFNKFLLNSASWREFIKKWDKEVLNKVYQFLLDSNIIMKIYRYEFCHETESFTQENIDGYHRYFELEKMNYDKTEDEWKEYNEIECDLNFCLTCFDCDEEIEITEETLEKIIKESDIIYKIIKDRDRSLDNV